MTEFEDRLFAELMEQYGPQLEAEAAPPARRPLLKRPRFVIGGAGLVASATTVGVVLSLTVAGTVVNSPPASAAAIVLGQAARSVPSAGDGRYAYVKKIDTEDDGGKPWVRTEEDWTPVDGKGTVTVRVQYGLGTPWRTTGSGDSCVSRLVHVSGCTPDVRLYHPTYDYLKSLPTDTAKLRRIVYDQARAWIKLITLGRPNPNYKLDPEAFSLIATLEQDVIPAPVAAALYRVAATIPGVTVVPDAVDAAGRHGVGVTCQFDSVDSAVVVFDRQTHQLPGSVLDVQGTLSREAIVARGLVPAVGDRP